MSTRHSCVDITYLVEWSVKLVQWHFQDFNWNMSCNNTEAISFRISFTEKNIIEIILLYIYYMQLLK